MLSVKELAEELGVSKTTLFKRIDKLNLRSELVKQGRALMIPEEVVNTLREAYMVSEETPEKAQKPNSASENDDITSSLIDMLKAELKSKEERIKYLEQEVTDLREDNRRYMAINTQLLLSGSEAPATENDTVEADFTEEPEAESENEVREEPEKKGFFRRLFGF